MERQLSEINKMVKIEPDQILSRVETENKEQDVIELIPMLLGGDNLENVDAQEEFRTGYKDISKNRYLDQNAGRENEIETRMNIECDETPSSNVWTLYRGNPDGVLHASVHKRKRETHEFESETKPSVVPGKCHATRLQPRPAANGNSRGKENEKVTVTDNATVSTERSMPRKKMHIEIQPCSEAAASNFKDTRDSTAAPLSDGWMYMYSCLVAYKKKHGHTRVPQFRRTDPNFKLGSWVKNRRHGCKSKKQLALLNAIGFQWRLKENDWMDFYERLVAYKKKHGHTTVPRKWKEDPALGNWVKNQRHRCKLKRRMELLDEIDFEWHPNEAPGEKAIPEQWMKMYRRLVAYKKKHGHTMVPQGCKEDPKLGMWAKNQRRRCKDKNRIDLLNAIDNE